MPDDIPLRFQIAILGDGARPIGSGLILDRQRVITCAHVVAQATSGKTDLDPREDIKIKLRCIPWPSGDPLRGKLLPGAWRSKKSAPGDRGVRDLAVIELTAPLEGWSDYCAIYPGSHVPRHEMTLFAFPKAQPDGIRSDIVIKGEVADGWRQIDATASAQYRVQGGFSGAPLFDPETNYAIGLVAEADPGEGRTGFLIPGRAIIEFLQSIPELRDLAEAVCARGASRNLPELPKKLMHRTALINDIKSMLTDPARIVGLIGLRGMGGIGKSVAARLLAEDDWIRRTFVDGIEWISVGAEKSKAQGELEALQAGLLSRLGGRIERDQSLDGLRQAIARELAGRRMILIVDDVWTLLAIQAFQIQVDGCAVVYTSRRRAGFEKCGLPTRDIELLDVNEAGELFRMHANLPAGIAMSEAAAGILQHCNRHALAIVVGASMLAAYPTKADLILKRFSSANVEKIVASVPEYRRSQSFPDQETSIFQVIKVSHDFLTASDQDFLKRLAIFPEDTPIPLSALEILSEKTLDSLECQENVTRLDDLGLLTFQSQVDNPDSSTITLHDLQHDFVVFLNKSPDRDHIALVDGLKLRFGGALFGDVDIPGRDYFRRFIVYHLIGAGASEALFDLLIDPDWIAHRLKAKDQVLEVIADYDRALDGKGRA
jgi:hypothetical protein